MSALALMLAEPTEQAPAAGVPLSVCQLPGLLALSLSANSLTEKLLPDTLSCLTSLTELWLNQNNFDQLPRCTRTSARDR